MLQFRVLGPVEAVVGGQRAGVTAGKQRALLALLLMHANAPVPADVLIDGLWGARPPATVAKNLQVLVSQLRKVLGEGAISTVSGGYQLQVDAGATDAARYELLLERGRRELADGRPRVAERTLDDALALWRGRPYEDVSYEEFARGEIERLEERRLIGVEQRFEAVLANGGHADAVADLERFASEHPARERGAELLMLALYRSGRQAEALAAYERVRRGLSEQLGIEPGAAIRELHEQILRHDPSLGATDRPPLMRPSQRRGPRLLLLAAAAALLIAAALAAALVTRSGGSASLQSLPGDTLGSIDPANGHILASYTVGATPTDLVSDGRTAWVLNADGGTISRVDLNSGASDERGIGATPAGIALAAGRLWVGTVTRNASSISRAGIVELDPASLRPITRIAIPGRGFGTGVSLQLAVAGNGLYTVAPDGRVVRLDLRTLNVARSGPMFADSMAAGGGSVWVFVRDRLLQLGGRSLRPVAAPVTVPAYAGVFSLAYGHGLVWGAETGAGDVWRIVPGPASSARTIHVGRSALKVAYGDGAVWTTSSVDGTVARIDPVTGRVTHVPVGASPQAVLPLPGRLLVTVAGGTAGPIEGGDAGDLATLPASSCGSLVTGGDGPPDVLIASDLDLGAAFGGRVASPMVQAIEYTLRVHGFRAGRYRVGYQSCDDSIAQTGLWDEGKCQANAHSFVATPSLVGVVGTLNSGCSAVELPVVTSADPPLAMISPANSLTTLTRRLPFGPPDEPARFYPTGNRTFARAYPSDDAQAKAIVLTMDSMGVRRPLVLEDDPHESYQDSLARLVVFEALRHGLRPIGPIVTPHDPAENRSFLEHRLGGGADAVFYASLGPSNDQGVAIRRSQRMLASLHELAGRPPVFLPDAFIVGGGLRSWAGAAASGIYVTGGFVTDPDKQLPPAGQAFVRNFSATQPGQVVHYFTPYAAQATEVLLSAIARSDGTRAGVARQLLKVRVNDGILGSFVFDRNGDMDPTLVPVFRVPRADAPAGPDPVLRLLHVRTGFPPA